MVQGEEEKEKGTRGGKKKGEQVMERMIDGMEKIKIRRLGKVMRW